MGFVLQKTYVKISRADTNRTDAITMKTDTAFRHTKKEKR